MGCVEINPFLLSTAALSLCFSAAPAQSPIPGWAGGSNLWPEGFAARAASAKIRSAGIRSSGWWHRQSPPKARQAEEGSTAGSQQHQAGGHEVGRLTTPHTQPQPSGKMKSLAGIGFLGDRSLKVSLPGGHQHSPLKAQTGRASTSSLLYRPKCLIKSSLKHIILPKSSPVSATSRLGTPCQEGKAQAALPPCQSRSTGTRPFLRAGTDAGSIPLGVLGKSITPRCCPLPQGVAATLHPGPGSHSQRALNTASLSVDIF